MGDTLHALSCTAGYNIRWLLRDIAAQAAKDAKAFFFALLRLKLCGRFSANVSPRAVTDLLSRQLAVRPRLIGTEIAHPASLAAMRLVR